MIEMDMPRIEVEENEEKSYAKIVVETTRKGFRSHNRQLFEKDTSFGASGCGGAGHPLLSGRLGQA